MTGTLIPKASSSTSFHSSSNPSLSSSGTMIPKAKPTSSFPPSTTQIPKSATGVDTKRLLQSITGTNGHTVEVFMMLDPVQSFPYFNNCIKCGFQARTMTLKEAIDVARWHAGF